MQDIGVILMIVSAIVLVARLAYLQNHSNSLSRID